MLPALIEAHSGWRYVVLLFLVVTSVKVLIGLLTKGKWSQIDEFLNRWTPIVIDIQVLLGLILWILEQRWTGADPVVSWEHPLTMIIASAVTHVTSTRVKKAPSDADKYKTATIGYFVAAVIVTLGVLRITRVL